MIQICHTSIIHVSILKVEMKLYYVSSPFLHNLWIAIFTWLSAYILHIL